MQRRDGHLPQVARAPQEGEVVQWRGQRPRRLPPLQRLPGGLLDILGLVLVGVGLGGRGRGMRRGGGLCHGRGDPLDAAELAAALEGAVRLGKDARLVSRDFPTAGEADYSDTLGTLEKCHSTTAFNARFIPFVPK